MALIIKDRVKEQTTTAGTGTVTLGGAVSGFDTFASVGDGNTTYYAIVHQSADEWEVGLGTYTAAGTTLSRDTVLESSNADAAVNFSAGTKDVFVTYPADKAVYINASDVVDLSSVDITAAAGTFTGLVSTSHTINTSPAAGGNAGLNATDGTRSFQFGQTGSAYSYNGVGANENLIYGSAAVIRFLADGQDIAFNAGSAEQFRITTGGVLSASNAAGPALMNEAATSTNPTLVPNRADPDTGVGANGAGRVYLISDGTARVTAYSSGVDITGALASTGTYTVGNNSSGNSASLLQSTGLNFKLNGDTASQLGVISWTNNSGVVTNNIWATGDSGTGIIRIKSLNTIDLVPGGVGIDGTEGWRHTTSSLTAPNSAGPALLNEAATSTNPTVVHNKAAPTYGLGGTSTETSLIGGGNEVVTAGNNTLSFFAAAPVAKQTITGSRGGNAALADLLTKLATIGLITDSTS